jgi:hypothetical protein
MLYNIEMLNRYPIISYVFFTMMLMPFQKIGKFIMSIRDILYFSLKFTHEKET